MHYFQGSREHRPPPPGGLRSYKCNMWEEFLSRTLAELFQLLHIVYQRVSGKYLTISSFFKEISYFIDHESSSVHHPQNHMACMYIILYEMRKHMAEWR